MFLCEKCHDNPNCLHAGRSYGRCEDCGKTRDTVDCTAYKTPPPKPKLRVVFTKQGKMVRPLTPTQKLKKQVADLVKAAIKSTPR